MKRILVLIFLFMAASLGVLAQDTSGIYKPSENILMEVKNLLFIIADSEIEIDSLQINDEFYEEKGIFSTNDISSFKRILGYEGANINQALSNSSDNECLSCNYTDVEKINKLKQIIVNIRQNKSEFSNSFDSFVQIASQKSSNETNFVSQGPKCGFAFYVCLGVGATSATVLSAGVAAAASVYLCACGYCQLKPPGCN